MTMVAAAKSAKIAAIKTRTVATATTTTI